VSFYAGCARTPYDPGSHDETYRLGCSMSQLTPFAFQQPTIQAHGTPPPADEQHDVVRFLAALLRRKWLFIGIVVFFVVLVGVLTYITPKSYTTTVRLMAGTASDSAPSNGDTALPILNALMLQSGLQTAETFAELIQQHNIAASVAKNLNLNVSPETLLTHVSVKPVSNTAILNVDVSWKNPIDSARIANEFANVFTTTERGYVQSQATAALGFLSAELPGAKERMQEAAAKLADFQAASGFVDANDHTQQIVARDSAIEDKIQTLTLDRSEAQAMLNNVPNPVRSDLESQLATVNSQLAIARERYTDKFPAVQTLIAQRDSLLAQIAAQPEHVQSGNVVAPNANYVQIAQQAEGYKARIDADTADLAQLQALHESLATTINQLPRESMQLALLQQRAKLASDVYQALQQKYTDAMIARTTAISDVSVIQPATADEAGVRPNMKLNLMIAPLIGLLVASIVVFVLDYLEQRTLRNASDVSAAIGLPVIATIPSFASGNRRALPWLQSMTVEAFLRLCVTLRLSAKGRLQTLLITSPSVGDGKSTIAYNLARAMSNIQWPILLIDGDMRRSVLHEHAACDNDCGLSEILQGEKTLSDAVHRVSPALDLLTAGKSVANPIALLQSHRFDELITEANQRYTMVIIDSPALACVADGFAISARVDGTALVVAANTTNEHEAKEIVSQFAALGIRNLVGVVLNKDRQRIDAYNDYFADARSALTNG
jgi:polysaccharide biosynthesis transport protein